MYYLPLLPQVHPLLAFATVLSRIVIRFVEFSATPTHSCHSFFSEDVALPRAIERPIEGLRTLLDGKQCRLSPDKCVFSCRSINS